MIEQTAQLQQAKFSKPSFEIGGDDAPTIAERCKEIARSTASLNLTSRFELYRDLVYFLKNDLRLTPVDLCDIGQPLRGEQISVALRHDIDADIETAVRCARLLSDNSIPGSFFVLHTAHYYSPLPAPGVSLSTITRHVGLRYFLDALSETRRDVGIHNDALGLYLNYGIDSCSALVQEVEWLRSQNVNVTGSAAHNSVAAYGAECFEIFENMSAGGRLYVGDDNKRIPLQQLDADSIGLEYEANFPIPRPAIDYDAIRTMQETEGDALRTPSWQQLYFIHHPIFARGYDYDVWLIGDDQWLLAGESDVQFPLSFTEVTRLLSLLPLGSRVVISVHPIYVSKD